MSKSNVCSKNIFAYNSKPEFEGRTIICVNPIDAKYFTPLAVVTKEPSSAVGKFEIIVPYFKIKVLGFYSRWSALGWLVEFAEILGCIKN